MHAHWAFACAALACEALDKGTWGDQVFAAENMPPNDSSLGWDGRFLEKEMNSQVFVYAAEVEFIDGTKLLFKGDVTLIK